MVVCGEHRQQILAHNKLGVRSKAAEHTEPKHCEQRRQDHVDHNELAQRTSLAERCHKQTGHGREGNPVQPPDVVPPLRPQVAVRHKVLHGQHGDVVADKGTDRFTGEVEHEAAWAAQHHKREEKEKQVGVLFGQPRNTALQTGYAGTGVDHRDDDGNDDPARQPGFHAEEVFQAAAKLEQAITHRTGYAADDGEQADNVNDRLATAAQTLAAQRIQCRACGVGFAQVIVGVSGDDAERGIQRIRSECPVERFEIQGIDNGFIAARLDAERAGRTRGVFHHLGGRPQDEAGRHDFAKRKCKILKGAQRWTRVGAAQADLPDRHQHDQQTKPHEKQRTQTDEPAKIFHDQHNALIKDGLKLIRYGNARDQDNQKELDWENRNIPSYGVVLWGMFYRWTQKQVFDYMQYVVETMEHSAIEALNGDIDMAGIISPAAGKVESYVKKDRRALDMGVLNSAVPWAMATMEYSSAMGVVLCAPTGGSAGIFPGAVLGVANHLGLPMDKKIKAMLVTAIIGIVMSKDCNYSAELYGCQVEPGAASGMAAGGLVYL